MCGRYTLTSPLEALSNLFGFSEQPNIAMNYNVAPTHDVAAIRAGDKGGRQFVSLSWGLVPSWAKDATNTQRLINARGETVANKPSFRDAFSQRRCLIAADGFYEWKTNTTNVGKQPYRITLIDGSLFAFAGIWERWLRPASSTTGSSVLETCAIITTTAAAPIAHIHARMPVILEQDDYETWLTSTPEESKALIRPYEGELEAYPVSTRVNAVRNNDSDLLVHVDKLDEEAASKGSQPDLF